MSASSKEKSHKPRTDETVISDWLGQMQTVCKSGDLERSVAPSVQPSIVEFCKHINDMTPHQERAKACLMTFGYTPGEFDQSKFHDAAQICGLGNVIGNGQGGTMGTEQLMQCVAHGGSSAPPICAPLTRIVETARQKINFLKSRDIGPATTHVIDEEKTSKQRLVDAVGTQSVDEIMKICAVPFQNQPDNIMRKIVDKAMGDAKHRVSISKVSEFVDLVEMCNQFRIHVAHDYLAETHTAATGGDASILSSYNDLFNDIVDSCTNVDEGTVTASEMGRALAARPTASTSVCQLVKVHASELSLESDTTAAQRDLAHVMNFAVSYNGGV